MTQRDIGENGNNGRYVGPPLEELITHLIGCSQVLSQIIASMVMSQRLGYSAPDAPEPDEVLRGLLTDVLESLVHEHPKEQLATTAALLEEVAETICDQLIFVPAAEEMEESRRRHEGRARPRSRRRR